MKFIYPLLILLLSLPVHAENVEIFLLEKHKDKIKNLDLARSLNHQIIYYYLDAEKAIEAKLTKEVEDPLNRIVKDALAGLSESDLRKLGEEKITALIMAKATEDKEFQDYSAVMLSVSNDPDITETLLQAEEDKKRAKKLGVLVNDLPAVYFSKKKFTQVTDLKSVIEDDK